MDDCKLICCNNSNTWALTFRGSWNDVWQEFKNNHYVFLTHGRKEISQQCSKNGIKKEGESCTLNNNCIYPKCLK